MDVLSAARSYTARGLLVVPIPAGSKGCRLKGWQNLRLTDADLPSAFRADSNVGVILGEPSGWLVDIDLDCDEAVELAEQFLPPTPAITGREGRPRSHWWYVCENAKTIQLADPQAEGKAATLELRSTGGQTVVGPSVHPDGSRYDVLDGEPARVPYGLLEAADRALHAEILKSRGHHQPTEPAPQKPAQSLTTFALRPGDDFNQRGDLRPVLEAHGWSYTGTSGDNELWRRPGKTDGHSATFDGTTFFVHTPSTPQFDAKTGYSKFEVYTRLAHNGDHTAAATALLAEGYGQSQPLVDLSGIRAQITAAPKPVSFDTQDPGELPEHMFDVPGFIHDVTEYTLATAHYPNRVLAFCGALSLQALLACRRVRTAYRTRPNLYVLALANSGAGKNRAREVNSQILSEAGCGELIASEFISGAGIEDRLAEIPSHRVLFQVDELDDILNQMARGTDQHQQSIGYRLLNLYSESAKLYALRARASEPPRFMDQPCLCLLGTAVPDTLYGSLSDRMLRKGLLARMLVFDSGKRGRSQKPRDCELSSLISDAVRYWQRFEDDIPDELRGRNLADMRAYPRAIDFTPDAEHLIQVLRDTADDEYDLSESQHDRSAMAMWARCAEKAEKLALIHACSVDHLQPLIGREAVEWASEVLLHQTRRMLFLTAQHFAENEQHASLNRVAAILREHGEMSRSQFTRKTQFLKRRERDELLCELVERGDAVIREATTGGRPQIVVGWVGA
jgi:hypothetical protein